MGGVVNDPVNNRQVVNDLRLLRSLPEQVMDIELWEYDDSWLTAS